MPELPEVETVRRSLIKHLIGRTIEEVEVFLPKIIRYMEVAQFQESLKNQQFLAIERRGKYLLAHLSKGWTLVVHLGMTGRLYYLPVDKGQPLSSTSLPLTPSSLPLTKGSEAPRHVHAILSLDNGGSLVYHDYRQFGYLTLSRTNETMCLKGLKELGPEPLEDKFSLPVLQRGVQGRKAKIKQLLLDQRLVAGIGNIYADEILFTAGLHPERSGGSLTDAELKKLYRSIRYVLQKGIEFRGTSINDYVDGEGHPGEFQHHLQVYQRTGQACTRCSSVIQRVKLGGRSSHFCPQCQTEPAKI